jgi:hypothetical protein
VEVYTAVATSEEGDSHRAIAPSCSPLAAFLRYIPGRRAPAVRGEGVEIAPLLSIAAAIYAL